MRHVSLIASWLGVGLCFFFGGCDWAAHLRAPEAGAPACTAGSHDASGGPAACRQPPLAEDETHPDDWFEDVTGRSGVRFTYRNGRESNRFFILEIIGGGLAMIDYDLDGDPDLFFTGGGTISSGPQTNIAGLPPALFRNDGDWQFVDVTASSGFTTIPDYSHGCTVTDFNVDGFPDLFVCCYGRSRLYRNRGDGSFEEAADEARLPARGWGTTAVFADVDRDGLPDLFLARYADSERDSDVPCTNREGVRDICEPRVYAGTSCLVLHNSGDGSFEDWSDAFGITGSVRGLGTVAADLNGDGWTDLYVASDESPKQLYFGGPELPRVESALPAGAALGASGRAEGSMGIAVGDYDGDGLPDIFVTNFETEDHALYRNLGDGQFLHSTVVMGLSGHSRMRSGWGTALVDFDGDGWLDIFILNGSPFYYHGQAPFEQVPNLFRNINGKRFEWRTDRGGASFRRPLAGRGSAVGDLDGDGAPDIVAVPINESVRILRNRMVPKNFVSVQLRALGGEPQATGARVTTTFEGRRITRFVVQGAGYGSHSDARLILPVDAAATAADVSVAWPGREGESFRRLKAARTHLLIEGRGEPLNELQ